MVLYRTILCLSFTLVFMLVSLVLIVFGYETKTILWNHGIGKKHVRALDLLAHYGHVMMNKNKIYTYKKSDYFFFLSSTLCSPSCAAIEILQLYLCVLLLDAASPKKKPEQMYYKRIVDCPIKIVEDCIFDFKWTSLGINTQISAIKLRSTSGFENI